MEQVMEIKEGTSNALSAQGRANEEEQFNCLWSLLFGVK